jgi:hypothetical protein
VRGYIVNTTLSSKKAFDVEDRIGKQVLDARDRTISSIKEWYNAQNQELARYKESLKQENHDSGKEQVSRKVDAQDLENEL